MRRAIAIVIFAVTALVVVASYFPSGIRSCHEELAQSGTVFRVCGPIGMSDVVGISLVLLFALLLLWPDLSEVTVFNLVGIKRRVAEVEKKTEEVERKTAKAGDDIRSLALSQSPPEDAAVEEALEGLKTQVAQAGSAISIGDAQDGAVEVTQGGRTLSRRRAASEAEAVDLAATLDRYLRVLDRRGGSIEELQRDGLVPASLYAPVALKRIVLWAAQTDNYLRQWSALRNNLVHSPERLSDEEVELALDLVRLLLRSLRHELERAARVAR
jgi:hypothetical protein